MDLPKLKVVLDANVLFPFTLRDTLLRGSIGGYYQVFWSAQILDETARNLIEKGGISQSQASHLLNAMQTAFPYASVEGYEALIDSMPNDEKDRHVSAVAVSASASIIVTNNLKDFRILPNGITAQSPDRFLQSLFSLDPEGMVELLEKQATFMQRPPKTTTQLIEGLAKIVPGFANRVLDYLNHP